MRFFLDHENSVMGPLVRLRLDEYMTISFPPLKKEDLQIDLMRNLGEMCETELLNMGYTNIPNADAKEMCQLYLNALYRRVSKQIRKFHQSKQLCVPVDVQDGFDLLKQKVEDGEDLTPHLSGLLDKLDFNDPLLNAWKIHHFHLGTKAHSKNPNLIERTGAILLAMVQDDDFYAIAILPHGKHGNPDVFYDSDLIEILHENFPDMMERYRINGRAAFPKPSNDEVKMIRDAGITMFAQTNDGTLYLPNFGFTSMGGTTKDPGAKVVFDAMKVVNRVRLLEKIIKEKAVALELAFSKTGGSRPYKVVLTDFLNNGYVTAREESSMIGMSISLLKGAPGEEWLDIWLEK